MFIDEGECTEFTLDGNNEVMCQVTLADGRKVDGVLRLRQPAGFQARPKNDRAGHDSLILRDGRLQEVLTLVDRDVTASLPTLQEAQTRIHSLEQDGTAQLISILFNEILLGKNAQKGVVRLDDHIDAGTITFVATPNPLLPAPPVFTLTITYTNVDGGVSQLGPLPFVGPSINGGAGGTVQFKLRGKTIEASKLVKAE